MLGFLFISLNMCHIETVLLSAHNIEIRKFIFITHFSLDGFDLLEVKLK